MQDHRQGDAVVGPDLARLAVGAVLSIVGLAAAFVAGSQSRDLSVAGLTLGADPPRLAAGALRSAPSRGGAPTVALPVHNAGEDVVAVKVVAVPGAAVGHAATTRIPAGAWAEVSLTVTPDCTSAPLSPSAVTLGVEHGAGSTRVELALTDAGRVLADLHHAECGAGRQLTADRLAGVWLVEQVFGRWTKLAGRHVLLFERDGTMVADPEGVRFTSHRGVLGRYVLRGDRLISVAQGFVGYACLPGEHAAWHAEQLPDGRVVLRFLGGRNCPDQPGERWVLRRLARPGP